MIDTNRKTTSRGDRLGSHQAIRHAASAVAIAIIAGTPVMATPLYWDLNGAAANTGTSATGSWDGVNAFWNDSPTGTGGTAQAVTAGSDDLFFSSGTNFTGASAISIAGSTADANSITIRQSGAVTLSGVGINLGGGAGAGLVFNSGTGSNVISAPVALISNVAITNNDDSTQNVSGAISGAFNIAASANGTGTLLLSGSNTSYSGITTINGGVVQGRNTTATNVLTAFGTGDIHLSSGTLQLRANGSGNGQTIVAGNSVTTGSSAVTIDVNNNGSNNSGVFTLGNLSIGAGQLNVTGGNSYRLVFAGAAGTLTGNAIFNPTTAGVSVNGAIGDGGSGHGITKNGSGQLGLGGTSTFSGQVRVNAGTLALGAHAPNGAAGSLGNATSAILLGDTSGSANVTVNEQTFTVGRDIVLQSGNTGTITLGSGNQGNTNSTYSGTITLGSANGTGKGITLAPTNFHITHHTGVIQDPTGLIGSGGVVTIAGGGSSSTVNLTNANTYAGGTVLNSGTLRIGNAQALGFGTLTINGGAISQTAAGALTGVTGQTWQGSFSFSATVGQINLGTSPILLVGARSTSVDNGPAIIGGVISGEDASLRVNSTNFNGSLTLNGMNTFDGGVTIAQLGTANTTIVAGSETALGTGQARLTNASGSRLNLNSDLTVDSLTSGANVRTTIAGGSGGTNGTYALIFTGGGGTGAEGTATISGGAITSVTITDPGVNYTSAPTITLSGGGGSGSVSTTFGDSIINLNPSVARTLTLAGTNASPATFAGVISGVNGTVIKNGSGVQTFSGTNTYTGITTVNAGVLNIDGSLASGSAVTVNDSGTLGGVGTVFGSVTLAGGTTGATLTSDATLSIGGTLLVGGTNNVASAGIIAVAGNTTINSGGEFAVNGMLSGAGGLSVSGVLSGAGAIEKDVVLTSAGVISPGNSPGVLTIDGDVTLVADAVFEAEINGLSPGGTGHDQLLVTGNRTISLGGSTLDATMGAFAASTGDILFLINNSGTGSTTGQFAGLTDDSLLFANTNGFDWFITYDADYQLSGSSLNGGNDVAIYAVPVPEPTSLACLAMAAGMMLRRRR